MEQVTLGVIGNVSRDCAIYPDGRRFQMLGGAALHVARAAARAGLRAAPITVVGADLAGIHDHERLADLSLADLRIADGRSSAFTLIYDRNDDVVIANTHLVDAEALTHRALAAACRYGRCHVCCRRPLQTGRVLAHIIDAGVPFTVDFHAASAATLSFSVDSAFSRADAVFVSRSDLPDLAMLADLANLRALVVSDGPRNAAVFRHGEPTATAMPEPTTPVEVTGAGDTLAGTFVAAMVRGLTDQQALHTAVAAATDTIRDPALILADPATP